MLHADPRGFLTLVAVAMSWALALVLYRAGVRGSVARKLALLLVFEGITLGSSSASGYFLTSPAETYRLYPAVDITQGVIHTLGDCAMLALYPPFLAAALNSTLTRPFAHQRVQIVIAVVTLLLFVAVMLAGFELIPWEVTISCLYLAMTLLFWFALVASIHAWRMSTGIARTRARIFALAFGFRDICWGFLYGVALLKAWSVLPAGDPNVVSPEFMVYALGTLLAVPLIAYGILRTQLFDIDLHIRWTLKQSTIAAAVVAIVFLISEGANRLLSSELGNVAGLLATALVVFFIAPLQRFAERVASAAMPNVRDTPEYAAFRKMQVYEAAVAEALQGGGISRKERALLTRLRDSLGIAAADADALERDLQAGTRGLESAAPA